MMQRVFPVSTSLGMSRRYLYHLFPRLASASSGSSGKGGACGPPPIDLRCDPGLPTLEECECAHGNGVWRAAQARLLRREDYENEVRNRRPPECPNPVCYTPAFLYRLEFVSEGDQCPKQEEPLISFRAKRHCPPLVKCLSRPPAAQQLPPPHICTARSAKYLSRYPDPWKLHISCASRHHINADPCKPQKPAPPESAPPPPRDDKCGSKPKPSCAPRTDESRDALRPPPTPDCPPAKRYPYRPAGTGGGAQQ